MIRKVRLRIIGIVKNIHPFTANLDVFWMHFDVMDLAYRRWPSVVFGQI